MPRKQSRMKLMEESGILPEYNGKGVYALVDQEGKMYIGSSINCRNRVYQHFAKLEDVRSKGVKMACSSAMVDAAERGVKFKCVILEELDSDTTDEQLRQHEQFWIEAQGGLHNTYNMLPATRNTKRDANGNIVFSENDRPSHVPFNEMIMMAMSHEGITITELSKRLKTSTHQLSSILTHKKCSMDELKKFCSAMDAKLEIKFIMSDGTTIG